MAVYLMCMKKKKHWQHMNVSPTKNEISKVDFVCFQFCFKSMYRRKPAWWHVTGRKEWSVTDPLTIPVIFRPAYTYICERSLNLKWRHVRAWLWVRGSLCNSSLWQGFQLDLRDSLIWIACLFVVCRVQCCCRVAQFSSSAGCEGMRCHKDLFSNLIWRWTELYVKVVQNYLITKDMEMFL